MLMTARRMDLALLLVAACASSAAVGCSASDKAATGKAPAAGSGGTITSDETWNDGKQIAAPIVIANGVTVTIAPGATVTLAEGASITLQGGLKSTSHDKHAKLTSATTWGGIVVESSGILALDGVDIANADTALAVHFAAATYDNGTISDSIPFAIGKGAKLSTAHATVTGAKAAATVAGALVASYLDYDASTFEGIDAQDPSATISIEDSKIHGKGAQDNDLIVARGAASIHVAYTEISKAHCTFHFENVGTFDISFVSLHDSAYGFMLYGSDTAGTRTIKSANIFKNHANGVDEGAPNAVNGSITISDGYWAQNGGADTDNIRQFTSAIKVSNMSTTTPVPGVGPR